MSGAKFIQVPDGPIAAGASAGDIADYAATMARELEALADGAGLVRLAAILRAAAREADSITDGDPRHFRRV